MNNFCCNFHVEEDVLPKRASSTSVTAFCTMYNTCCGGGAAARSTVTAAGIIIVIARVFKGGGGGGDPSGAPRLVDALLCSPV